MSSYFDAKMEEVGKAAERFESDDMFLAQVANIEREMFDTISLVAGDREFPDDLREKIMGAFATQAVFSHGVMNPMDKTVDYVLSVRCSRVIDDIHELFHDLARRRIQTRFGRFSDNPPMILALRDEYDAHCSGHDT